MMRKSAFLLPILFCLLLLPSLPLFAQEAGKLVLRRVFIEPVSVELLEPENEALPSLYRRAPQLLYQLITSRQALVRVEDRQKAHSRIETRFTPAGPDAAGGRSVHLLFRLVSASEEAAVYETKLTLPPSHEAYSAALEEAAARFTPLLGRVEPEVQIASVETDEETKEDLDEILFEERTASRFEAGLWIGIASKTLYGDEGNSIQWAAPTHYVAEFSWFPARNHGLTANLLFAYSDMFYFGGVVGTDNVDGESIATLVLPGIGYTYRTLGRLSGGFFFGYNAGMVFFEARDDLVLYYNDEILNAGERDSLLRQLITIRPFISYLFNENWGVKTSMALFIEPAMMIGETGYISDLQNLNLCISYRFNGRRRR